MELLTGSGEVPVYYIQRWHHHFESGTSTLLKVYFCGPLYLCAGEVAPT